jgi:hypothetical protein
VTQPFASFRNVSALLFDYVATAITYVVSFAESSLFYRSLFEQSTTVSVGSP